MKALGKADRNHSFRLGRVAFGRILAPHSSYHLLQFGEVTTILEVPHFLGRGIELTNDPIGPQHFSIEDHPRTSLGECRLSQPQDFLPPLLKWQIAIRCIDI